MQSNPLRTPSEKYFCDIILILFPLIDGSLSDPGQFVKIRSMHVGLSGFLQQVGLFVILIKLKLLQNIFIDESSISALKSPKKSKRSCLVVNKSNLFLNFGCGLIQKFFQDYKNNLTATFFYFVSLSPHKKPSIRFSSTSKSFKEISSQTFNRISPP